MGYQYGASRKALRPIIPAEQPAPTPVSAPRPALEPKPKPEPKERTLKPCGTEAAYNRHRSHGQQPCAACVKAHSDYLASRRGTAPENRRNTTAECGTYSGALRHYRHREKPCGPCAKAHRKYTREYRARKALEIAFTEAYVHAMKTHPDDALQGPRRLRELNREVQAASRDRHLKAVS